MLPKVYRCFISRAIENALRFFMSLRFNINNTMGVVGIQET
jgi:hypothetical protein